MPDARPGLHAAHVVSAASAAARMGSLLVDMKGKLGHGDFLPWLEAEFAMSERSAQNFMRVADRFDSNSQLLRI